MYVKEMYTVGEAAKMTHMTSETLRHYDRIGLVKPSKTDDWTRYRYYTQEDIVRLRAVHALRGLELSLSEIRQVLSYDDPARIADFLAQAESELEQKIVQIRSAQAKILKARANYEKRDFRALREPFVKKYPARAILLADEVQTPTLEILWNYLARFYDQIPPQLRERFAFENLAGIYSENGLSKLFAVCSRYTETDQILVLPEGNYLCAGCAETDREAVLANLQELAKDSYNVEGKFSLQIVIVTGILQWNYEIQIFVDREGKGNVRKI